MEESSDEINKKSENIYKSSIRISIAILLIMVVASIIVGLFMTLSITHPLSKVVSALKKGEDGDMHIRAEIRQRDEIGTVANSVNNFFEKIQNILKNLHINSNTLAGASEELSSVSKQLASGATHVSENVSGMSQAAKESAQGATQVNQSANDLAKIASDMKQTVSLFKV